MKEQLKKQDMVVGKQYKGYAWRNEYGEFLSRYRVAKVVQRPTSKPSQA